MQLPWRSDGCSSPIQAVSDALADLDFKGACIVHDYLYWQGGHRETRRWADRILRRVIQAESKYPWAAPLYFAAVRAFGWLPFSDEWAWGYGWAQEYRGTDTAIPVFETPYTTENQRWKLEQALRNI